MWKLSFVRLRIISPLGSSTETGAITSITRERMARFCNSAAGIFSGGASARGWIGPGGASWHHAGPAGRASDAMKSAAIAILARLMESSVYLIRAARGRVACEESLRLAVPGVWLAIPGSVLLEWLSAQTARGSDEASPSSAAHEAGLRRS